MPFQDSIDQPPGASKRVCLGKITGAHGIKGLVKILAYGEDPSLIETLSPVYTSEDGTQTLEIRLKNAQKNHFLAEVKGVDDRNGSEALNGTELYVLRNALPDIDEENTYYYEDLVGLAVHDESGNPVGSVLGVHNFGAGDLLDIQSNLGGDSFLLPFTDEYVPGVSDVITIRNYEEFVG